MGLPPAGEASVEGRRPALSWRGGGRGAERS
uniref:Uncharacterized protein n=1 Tax=Arundo donax TaxID=35708 RepID=A0A0A9FAE1_ARUDO